MNYKYRHYRETENILRVNSNIQQNLKYRSITIIMLVGVSDANFSNTRLGVRCSRSFELAARSIIVGFSVKSASNLAVKLNLLDDVKS